MKTSIKTLIASSLTAIVLTSSIFATSALAAEKKPKTVSAPTTFKRVSVKGNVEITIIQRQNDGINYTEDNTGKAKITQEGDLLRISSTDKEACKLIVYVNDIYRIEASDNVIVKTSGKLKTRFLQIFIKGSAHADISSTTEGLYTVIEGNAELKLSGATDNHTLVMGKTPKLTIDRFAALRTNISSTEAKEIETAALIK
ncbi:GIN domain-containing protein [Pedobacter jamesrossensis]|uniref:GIN domain-containing protein n=1 Tax=Pedobacter jamesrossensis TaxID=1908238 RepID=A0ABV8NR51_9SPHI